MSRSRPRAKLPSLRHVEPAIVRGYSETEVYSPDSRLYVTALDVTSTGLQVYASTALRVGEVLELSVYLEGQAQPHALKGVTRWVGRCDSEHRYVLGIELLADHGANRTWQQQFH